MRLIVSGRVTIRARVLQMALRASGVTCYDVQQAFTIQKASTAHCHLVELEKAGYIHRQPPTPNVRIRYRATPEGIAALQEVGINQPHLADVASPIRTIGPTAPSRHAVTIHSRMMRPGIEQVVAIKPAKGAPVEVRDDGRPRGEAITPEGLVPASGKAAGYDPRYQCAPGEQPWGAGFAAAGIGRDIATGRQWGA